MVASEVSDVERVDGPRRAGICRWTRGPRGFCDRAADSRPRDSRRSTTASRAQLDLRDQAEVSHWFKANRPEYVFLVAGTVGGILANSTRPAEFIYDNMMIHGTVVQRGPRVRHPEAAVPGVVVHLPSSGHATDYGGRAADGPAASRPTNGTQSPRSPESSCARPTGASTAATSSRRCRRICTARTTTST